MRWIKSNDLRLIQAEFFQNCSNPDLTYDQWQKISSSLFGSPLVFALYGCDKQGKISQAITGFFNPMDSCLYLENFFNGAKITDPGVHEILEQWKRQGNTKIKILNAEELEV